MKLPRSFDKFLEDEVDLNKSRLDRIADGIRVVEAFLQNNEFFKRYFIELTPQGSYRQGTGIKPQNDGDDFDVDVLFRMSRIDGWEPEDYPNKLHEEFKKTDRYKDIVDKRGKTRCVTLDYASDFHIDIVPCIELHGHFLVMNRKDNVYEETDADGYTQWFNRKNEIVGSNHLINVVKLMKFIRDYKTFPMKSVLLTTILGNQVHDNEQSNSFTDLQTTLQILMGRFDDYLQSMDGLPEVKNPVLPSETFMRHWDQEKFEEAKEKIRNVRLHIDEAVLENDPEVNVEKWRKVFGDSFPLHEDDVGKTVQSLEIFSLGNTSHRQPITAIPGCHGERLNPGIKIGIGAYLYSSNGKIKFRGIKSDAKFASDLSIKYVAYTNAPEPHQTSP